jgi:hypothetical protein
MGDATPRSSPEASNGGLHPGQPVPQPDVRSPVEFPSGHMRGALTSPSMGRTDLALRRCGVLQGDPT